MKASALLAFLLSSTAAVLASPRPEANPAPFPVPAPQNDRAASSCTDSSNPFCQRPGIPKLCAQAYNKFQDDVVYTRNRASKSASRGGYTCQARLVCNSGQQDTDGGILWDEVSGYDIKVALRGVQRRGCACGEARAIQDNCYFTLQAGRA